MSDELLVGIQEAARRLAMNRRTLQRMLDRRELPFVQPPGGTRKIAVRDLEAYVERLRVPAVASNAASSASPTAPVLTPVPTRSQLQRRANVARRQRDAAL